MEVQDEVDLVADVVSSESRWVDPIGTAAGVVKRIAALVEPEVMVLHPHRQPRCGIEVQVSIQVVDILPTDKVHPTEIVMTEGELLIEGVDVARRWIAISAGVVVVQPKRRR